MNLEKKIYVCWAFKEHEREMSIINHQIYKELKEKYKINEGEDSDIVYNRIAGYNHSDYFIKKCPDEVTEDELALICDKGNLCFGYKGNRNSKITVFED